MSAKSFAEQFAETVHGMGCGPKPGEVPVAVACKNTNELAHWFMRFAWACRANLPAEEVCS